MRPILLILFLLPLPTQAATLHVSKAGNGTDGSSWENAFVEIGDAIEAATSGDQIWVASGAYIESLELTNRSNIEVYGGFDGTEGFDEFGARDIVSYETIIDATSLNKRCMTITSSSRIILDGFTLRNGRLDSEFAAFGGGVYIRFGEVLIRNCKIHDNYVGFDPQFNFSYSGGGIFARESMVVIENCQFIDNVALFRGGAIFMFEGGVFPGNSIRIVNSLFHGNVGTAVAIEHADVDMQHCTFGVNYRWPDGVFFDLNGFPPGRVTVTNCIIRDVVQEGTTVTYSNIRDHPGQGNIDVNPGWIDLEGGDFHLRSDSPCIDSGTDVEVLNDLDGKPRPVDVMGRGIGQGFDMGCYEFQLKRADLDENGRVDGEDLLMFQEEWMREGDR